MPIDFDSSNVDVSGVDDRRGRGGGGGLVMGGGMGIVGIIIAVLFMLLGGNSGSVPIVQSNPGNSSAQAESSEQLKARCAQPGALNEYTDCRIIKVYNISDRVWRQDLSERGFEYTRPTLSFFDSQTQTGCGPATSDVGPFYCPADRTIYFDLAFLQVLQDKFGASGEFAQAYITAHEFGHHLQTLLGIEPQVRRAQENYPGRANEWSVAMELQADCFAGVWAKKADESNDGIGLTQDNINEALNAAAAVGDDRIQAKVQGRVDPEGWTHGSAEQRQEWFATGYKSGTIDNCNTYQHYGLSK